MQHANKITVATADANIKWKDIVVTIDNPLVGAWRCLYYMLVEPYAGTVNNTAVLATADVTAGDYIFLV